MNKNGSKNKNNNYAFIDGQNLHSGVSSLGWKVDYKKFREYLRDEFGVVKAFLFIGFMEENQDLYNALQDAGFILFFKPILRHHDDAVKGNIDTELVLHVMIELGNYNQAVIVSGDGDFVSLVRHLISINKLRALIIPNKEGMSSLYKRIPENEQNKYFVYVNEVRGKIGFKNKKIFGKNHKN